MIENVYWVRVVILIEYCKVPKVHLCYYESIHWIVFISHHYVVYLRVEIQYKNGSIILTCANLLVVFYYFLNIQYLILFSEIVVKVIILWWVMWYCVGSCMKLKCQIIGYAVYIKYYFRFHYCLPLFIFLFIFSILWLSNKNLIQTYVVFPS